MWPLNAHHKPLKSPDTSCLLDLLSSHTRVPRCVTSTPTGVTINTYKVIYNLIDDVKAAMEGKLRAVEEKQQLGEATVSHGGQAAVRVCGGQEEGGGVGEQQLGEARVSEGAGGHAARADVVCTSR